MCEDPIEFEQTVLIEDLQRQHLESIQKGESWKEKCTLKQHEVFQWQSWAGYIENKIFLTFTVRGKVMATNAKVEALPTAPHNQQGIYDNV